MVYSMTGYGKGNAVLDGKDITVEIKSVNHRYFEYSSRMSRAYRAFDDKIKKELQTKIQRGKVEVSLMIRNVDQRDMRIEADTALAKSYYDALCEIARATGAANNVDAVALSKYDGVLTPVKNEEDADKLWRDINSVLHIAMDEFIAMRAAEGEKLRRDVLSRLETVEKMVEKIERDAPLRVAEYQDKLYKKLQTILEDKQIDERRILTEAAIFADRVAVDEETIRLHSHIAQYRAILDSDEARGRKLDFLTQELNRETNTIGSKSNDLGITNTVVRIKAEIEKIREQIQNIE
ncbi:MAG: YicC family protein [Oscillospiraceae bacterium]|nr:YicC family protein [Oscillospiraceae bacterium]